MVSGWDKNPGPGNDYTPTPLSIGHSVGWVALTAAVALAAWWLL